MEQEYHNLRSEYIACKQNLRLCKKQLATERSNVKKLVLAVTERLEANSKEVDQLQEEKRLQLCSLSSELLQLQSSLLKERQRILHIIQAKDKTIERQNKEIQSLRRKLTLTGESEPTPASDDVERSPTSSEKAGHAGDEMVINGRQGIMSSSIAIPSSSQRLVATTSSPRMLTTTTSPTMAFSPPKPPIPSRDGVNRKLQLSTPAVGDAAGMTCSGRPAPPPPPRGVSLKKYSETDSSGSPRVSPSKFSSILKRDGGHQRQQAVGVGNNGDVDEELDVANTDQLIGSSPDLRSSSDIRVSQDGRRKQGTALSQDQLKTANIIHRVKFSLDKDDKFDSGRESDETFDNDSVKSVDDSSNSTMSSPASSTSGSFKQSANGVGLSFSRPTNLKKSSKPTSSSDFDEMTNDGGPAVDNRDSGCCDENSAARLAAGPGAGNSCGGELVTSEQRIHNKTRVTFWTDTYL